MGIDEANHPWKELWAMVEMGEQPVIDELVNQLRYLQALQEELALTVTQIYDFDLMVFDNDVKLYRGVTIFHEKRLALEQYSSIVV